MSINLYGQAVTFVLVTAIGFGFGVFYDVFRMCFKGFIGDLTFWAITLAVFFFLILQINFGQIRFFVFLGMGIGFVLYLNTLRPMLKKPLSAIEKYVKMKVNKWHERRLERESRFAKTESHDKEFSVKKSLE
jgi:hypothetical protein